MSREECDHALRLIADTLAHPLHPHATVRETKEWPAKM